MTVIRFNETQINTVRNEYDFRTNLENPYLIEKSSELINTSFTDTLKIIDEYKKKIDLELINKKYKYNKHHNKKHNKSFNFRRDRNYNLPPKDRPKTFLNTTSGKDEEIKKEINGNLNKLSNNNSKKISEKILSIFKENYSCFDYNHFIECLFDKAVMQPTYCPLYVKVLVTLKIEYEYLSKQRVENKFTDMVKDKCNIFMSMIQTFETTDDDVLNVDNYSDFCDKNKKKIYKKGFSQFIGELYKNNFVSTVFIKDYLDALTNSIKICLEKGDDNIENSTICLVQLIETALTKRQFKESNCYKEIVIIKDHPKLSKKLKFKYMDLLGV
jgi:hypothetical protein